MNKVLKAIVGIVLGGVVIFGIYKFITYKEPVFDNKIEFSGSNIIINDTEVSYLDTITYVGLESLNIDSVNVRIYPLDLNKASIQDVNIGASITGNSGVYVIFIKEAGRSKSIEILAHELIHLKQHQSERLILDGKVAIWLGDTLSTGEYNKRPWEIEAFNSQDSLEKEIRNILYK